MDTKQGMLSIGIACLIICAFVGVTSAPTLSPTVIYVPDDYATIQAAVNTASPGDTIIVRDGTYIENIEVDKSLTIRSENGADTTIVRAKDPNDPVFEVNRSAVEISGFTVEEAYESDGIRLHFAWNCKIAHNICTNNLCGIVLDFLSNNNCISHNNCSNNEVYGIVLRVSNNNRITDNTLSNNMLGIYLFGFKSPEFEQIVLWSTNNSISNNNCFNNWIGIFADIANKNSISSNKCSNNIFGIASLYSNDNIISNNQCLNNSGTGITIEHSDEESISNNKCSNNYRSGISLEMANDNSVSNNNYSYNNLSGITLVNASNNCISNNDCSYNGCGIALGYSSSKNTIYLNNFINNANNVYSYQSTNIWNSIEKITYTYNGSTYTNYMGNYWDDYTDVDVDNDGIWDNPYGIDSDKDNYPLIAPFENYLASTPPTSTLNSVHTETIPIIDGDISPGEWLSPINITLNGFYNPENTKEGRLYVMNDNRNIYIAIVIPDSNQDADYLMLDFDQDNDHIANVGDEDAAGFNVGNLYGGCPVSYGDYYWGDWWWSNDNITHGSGAISYSNGKYIYEFSKPLNSDDQQDMNLKTGDVIGFRIETWDNTASDWYRFPKNTVDADTSKWNEWADLMIAKNAKKEQTAWTITKVYGAKTATVLYSGSSPGPPVAPGKEEYNFRPDSVDEVFLLVEFQLKAAEGAKSLGAQEVILVINGIYVFHPVGFSDWSHEKDYGWRIGEFKGTFTPNKLSYSVKVNLETRTVDLFGSSSGKSSWSFAYVVPRKYIIGDNQFELRILGSKGVTFNVKPVPQPQAYSSISLDGNYIGVVRGKTLYLFGKTSNTPLWSFEANYPLQSVEISEDGSYILTTARKKHLIYGPHTLFLFHKSSPEPVWAMDVEDYRAAKISEDGSRIAIAANKEGGWGYYVYLIDASTGNLVRKMPNKAIFSIEDLAVSSNGNYIAVAGHDAIYLFDGFKFSEVWAYYGGRDFNTISISSNGNYIGAAYESTHTAPKLEDWTYTHTVLMFRRNSGTPLWDYTSSIAAPGYAYRSSVISTDGNFLIVWGSSKLSLFSQSAANPLWSKNKFPSRISSVGISSGGDFIAVGCGDSTIYLLDNSGNTLWNRSGIGKQVGISHDGKTMVVTSNTSMHLLNTVDSTTIWSYHFS